MAQAKNANVLGGVEVRVLCVSTRLTTEQRLILAVRLLTMTAFTASSTGVSWVDQDDWNSFKLRLILDERAKLKE